MGSYCKKWLKITISISLFTFLAISTMPSSAWATCSTSWSRSKDWGSSETLTEPDLEGEYDRGYTFGTNCFNTSSGHDHDGSDSAQLDWDLVWSDASHDHSSAAEGGATLNLDWDDVWSDAVHSHASDAEGGTVTAHASTVAESITAALIGTGSALTSRALIVDGDGGASFTGKTSEIKDDNGDTKVQTEESNNENKIRFDTGGTERAVLDSSGFQLKMDAASPPQANTMVKDSIIKGWVNFQGSSTVNASFNVSSITDNDTGDYTINWDRDFADANYAIACWARFVSGQNVMVCSSDSATSAYLAGSVKITTARADNSTVLDPTIVTVIAVGSQ